MSTVIAQRQLRANGEPLLIRVFQPRLDDSSTGTWACDYEVSGADLNLSAAMYGVDSYQALMLTMQIIPSFIETSAAFKAGKITWLDRQLTDDSSDPFSIGQVFALKALGRKQ
jgi:hypothetical protein